MVKNEKKEKVNHPDHYNSGKYETIDIIESVLGKQGCYDFCIGNALKYICRAGHKENTKEDLEKAIWYLQYGINLFEENGEK